MPIRLIVPDVSVVEMAGEFAADAVGISKRTLEKRNNSAKLFFMKGEASPGFEYNISERNVLQGSLKLCNSYWNNSVFAELCSLDDPLEGFARRLVR